MDGNMGILHRTHELHRESTEDSSTHFSTEAAMPTTTTSTTPLKSFEDLTSTVHSTGLILYQIMAYLTKINNRRTMYQSGLRTLGEAMHVVTRSAAQPARDSSPARPGVPRINTPTIGRKRALCDSPSTARVLREARRGT